MRLVLADPVGALSNYDLKSLDAVGQNIIHISDRNEGFFVQNCSCTLNFIWICFAFWLLPSLWYSLINWQSYILSPFFGLTKGNIVKTIISTFVQVVYKAKAAL